VRAASRGGTGEYLFQNLVYRLIEAAKAGTAVAGMRVEDSHRIAVADAFMKLSEAERWRALCSAEPRLAELELAVASGRFGRLPANQTSRLLDTGRTKTGPDGRATKVYEVHSDERTDGETQELFERSRNAQTLRRKVAALVGPDSSQTDVLLLTVRAQQSAVAHLLNMSDDPGPVVTV
jgi:hypothetical protein